jgi:two-component system cell cycle response regulator DivK
MGRILIVEDDPWSRRIVCDLLEMHGHEVLAAADVAAARTLLEAQPALVLLDIHVPGGGGQALLAEIRAREGMAALPVIAFTASAMAGDRERFLKEGFTGYLSKPIDVKEFARAIASYL